MIMEFPETKLSLGDQVKTKFPWKCVGTAAEYCTNVHTPVPLHVYYIQHTNPYTLLSCRYLCDGSGIRPEGPVLP